MHHLVKFVGIAFLCGVAFSLPFIAGTSGTTSVVERSSNETTDVDGTNADYSAQVEPQLRQDALVVAEWFLMGQELAPAMQPLSKVHSTAPSVDSLKTKADMELFLAKFENTLRRLRSQTIETKTVLTSLSSKFRTGEVKRSLAAVCAGLEKLGADLEDYLKQVDRDGFEKHFGSAELSDLLGRASSMSAVVHAEEAGVKRAGERIVAAMH